jgi:hypothetical protein
MLAQRAHRFSGSVDPGTVEADASIRAVISCLERSLRRLVGKVGERGRGENEPQLNQHLYTSLQIESTQEPFFFHKEWEEGQTGELSRRSDVAVQAHEGLQVQGMLLEAGTRFVCIEAKRLPTPGTGRAREYVEGGGGAIERFKRGIHGADLRQFVVVAYVQEEDHAIWLQRINGWIDDRIADSLPLLPWDGGDRLVADPGAHPPVARHRSTSLRCTDGERLSLRHLWVDLVGSGNNAGRN